MAKVEGKVLRWEGLVVSCNLYPPSCHPAINWQSISQCVYAVVGKAMLSQSTLPG